MAAKLPKATALQVEIRLRCPQCGYQEGGRLRRAESARNLAEQPQQTGT
jgi:uncharacterized protein (DUF983 family)